MKKKLFIISNRLPLTIEQNEQDIQLRQSSGGLVSAISAFLKKSSPDTFSEQIWAGFPDCNYDIWQRARGAIQSTRDYTYLPVFIEEELYQRYYQGFSNSLIWPLFHYFPSFAEYNDDYYNAYIRVNELFAEAVSQQVNNGDMVWIQDYHLLPLAAMLRRYHPTISIGFFLHIPFPSYELFRLMPKPWQHQLLKGMAAADLIGFHTIDYAADFLACIANVLKIEHDGQFFRFEERLVKADAFPIGIDFDQFHEAAGSEEVSRIRQQYIALKGPQKMIFSVDRLDYTKGLHNRLKGYHRFLTQHPEYIGKVMFVLVVIPSRDEIDKYSENKRIIDEYIGNLNGSLGDISWLPVRYHYNHLPFEELVGLYTACDLALITPLRDGMNLVAKEYVASQNDGKGVLILSEMAGAARELTDALLINPNDTKEMADAIKTGIEMSESEQRDRMAAMQKVVKKYNINAWANDFFATLGEVIKQQGSLETKFLDNFSSVGLLDAYARSSRRLLLLDYDGTLIPFSKEPSEAIPDPILLQTLKDLSADKRNHIYIISGRDSESLEKWLGHLEVGLIAEHGAKIKNIGRGWQNEAFRADEDWMAKIRPLMELQSDKCVRSFIEEKEFSLAWHYRNAELVHGGLMAKELFNRLLNATANLPVNVLAGNKVIEVRPNGIDKGSAVTKLISEQSYDFILCLGDDKTDEDMFKILASVDVAYTIKVGQDASFAKYNIQSPHVVRTFLQTIVDYPELPPTAVKFMR
ncbi:bifunctional alpha,alpha-trehalose-phosphate synthase (UDP-forming)/trehalose-phosphatase [Inquilinus sp. KBS0705]|nr:bifunctional alpha,alpha-trehalose-phosphate synthase (UDP-forming)/trehalose-phosphatase [Inquilinus sp. KBS0705]